MRWKESDLVNPMWSLDPWLADSYEGSLGYLWVVCCETKKRVLTHEDHLKEWTPLTTLNMVA